MPGLPDEVERLWQAYLAAEGREHRSAVLAKLRAFVTAFSDLPIEVRRTWVREFCRRAFEDVIDRYDIPKLAVRQPLAEGVLLPLLIEWLEAGDQEVPLWLSWIADARLTRDDEEVARRLGLPSFTRAAILRRAVDSGGGDDAARRALVSELARWFDFTLHELPAGVLYGMDGATAEQCEELLEAIEDYRRLAPVDDPVRHDETAWWSFHFRTYRDYLRDRRDARGYADYLRRFAQPVTPARFETGRRYPFA